MKKFIRVRHPDAEVSEIGTPAPETMHRPTQRERVLETLRSGAPLSQPQRMFLINLLERQPSVPAAPRPRSAADSRINAQVLAEFADEFRRQPWPRGPITRAEMDTAVKVMQRRETAQGRGKIEFDGKRAASDLREERYTMFANYYGLTVDELKAAVLGKHGSINRAQKKPPA
jgi:hypothetical protein